MPFHPFVVRPAAALTCALLLLADQGGSRTALAQSPPTPAATQRTNALPLPADADALFTPAYALALQNGQPPFLLRTVFRRLAAQQSGSRAFTETRNFSISKRPVTARGTLRYSRRHGLSMAYEPAAPGQPPSRVLVIDDKGLIERNAEGRERSIAVADRPELAALTDVYLNLLRGDATRLFAASDAFFAGDKRGWQLGLVPKDAGIARRVGRAVVYGRGPNIQRIETISGNGDVRRLELGPIQPSLGFSPEELRTLFRGTEG